MVWGGDGDVDGVDDGDYGVVDDYVKSNYHTIVMIKIMTMMTILIMIMIITMIMMILMLMSF